MATYLSPGVYVEEIPSAQKAIAGVGTNTVGFIGKFEKTTIKIPVPDENYDAAEAEKAIKNESQVKKIDKAKEDLKEARNTHGLAKKKADAADTDAKKPGLTPEKKAEADQAAKEANADMEKKRKMMEKAQEILNDLEEPPKVDETKITPYKLDDFEVKVKEGVAKLCTNFGEYTKRFGGFSADSEEKDLIGTAMDPGHRALTHAVYGFFQNGGTRCFVAWVKPAGDFEKALRSFESIDAVAIIAAPGFTDKDPYEKLQAHCFKCKDRFAILDCPEKVEDKDGEVDIDRLNYDKPNPLLPKPNKNSAYYFPWIEVMDPAKRLQDSDLRREVEPKYRGRVYVQPSGHMAGIYARSDVERGVHKAPANTPVMGALNVKYYIGRPKHDLLNPQGVNVIRNINGNILVWGARTIGGNANNEWKYISVRRLFLYLRESIDEGTQWVVFEPNDPALWLKIRRNVGHFLTNVWRSGALFGATPEQAFYVKCDEETNPPEVRELGQVITEIGVAIVRPAEFVIFKITQAGSLENM